MNYGCPLRLRLLTAALACAGASLAQGQTTSGGVETSIAAPRVDIIGKKENLDRIPGAGYILEKDVLESSRVFTVNEALRKIPGVNVRDEEGLGIRPNIGIRGLNPTRSTKITLLEDGIPLSYAPYGDNASYYHPQIDRFERIEVLKGAGQIMYGPQTIGGVINYITPTPPQAFSGSIGLAGGSREYLNAHLRLGGGGYLLDYVRKQGLGARDNTDSAIDDLNLKKLFNISDTQSLILRANYYTENSVVTYSGITNAEFENFGARYNPFKNDSFDTKRLGLSATHQIQFSPNATLITNIYGSTFDRDWWRQSSTTTDAQCGATFTQARLSGQAVDVNSCNSIQGRLRYYTQYGIEPRMRVNYSAFGLKNEIDFGLRAHFETQNRRQVNRTSTVAGDPGTIAEDNLRETTAYAGFVQNRILIDKLTISPGLRYELIDNTRTDRRTGGNSGSSSLSAVIPSLGASYTFFPGTTAFAGVHRGFAPPRTEDLIITGTTPSATFTEVGAEKSWNYELGMRAAPIRGLNLQGTYFRNDFKRLIAVGSIAGGNLPVSQGEALFQGIELAGRYDATSGVYTSLALTWLPTAEQTTAFTNVTNGATVNNSRAGNRLPYAPRNTMTFGVGYLHESGIDVNVEAVRVSEQFSDFANVGDASSDPQLTADQQRSGQFGKINAYTIFNAAINYRIPQYKLTMFLTVKNIADKVYIVDRTRGILPGAPRLIQAGLRYDF